MSLDDEQRSKVFAYRRSSDEEIVRVATELHHFRQQYHRDQEDRKEFYGEVKADLKAINASINEWKGGLKVLIPSVTVFAGIIGAAAKEFWHKLWS